MCSFLSFLNSILSFNFSFHIFNTFLILCSLGNRVSLILNCLVKVVRFTKVKQILRVSSAVSQLDFDEVIQICWQYTQGKYFSLLFQYNENFGKSQIQAKRLFFIHSFPQFQTHSLPHDTYQQLQDLLSDLQNTFDKIIKYFRNNKIVTLWFDPKRLVSTKRSYVAKQTFRFQSQVYLSMH